MRVLLSDTTFSYLYPGGKQVMAEKLLYSVGRTGNTEHLGLEAAGLLADDRGRITFILRRCVTRPPAEDELRTLQTFVTALRDRKTAEKDVWTALARAALNLDETVVHP